MSKSNVVRFSLIAVLLLGVTNLVIADREFWYQSAPTAVGVPTLIADGPSPVPWPPVRATQSSPRAGGVPTLIADGPSPVPWPPVRATRPKAADPA